MSSKHEVWTTLESIVEKRLKMAALTDNLENPKKVNTKKSFWRAAKEGLRLVAAPFVIAVAVNAFFILFLVLSQNTAAKAKQPFSGEGSVRPVLSVENHTPMQVFDVELAVTGKSFSEDAYSFRWWLNEYLIKGYSKRTLSAMGLKKGDRVKVEVLDRFGRVVAERSLEVVKPTLPLRS